jgi:hypothetical protein
MMYRRQGKLDQAEDFYRRAVEGQSRALGPDFSRYTEVARFELWDLYSARAKHSQADELMKKHLAELGSKFGADSIQYGNALFGFSTRLQEKGRRMRSRSCASAWPSSKRNFPRTTPRWPAGCHRSDSAY